MLIIVHVCGISVLNLIHLNWRNCKVNSQKHNARFYKSTYVDLLNKCKKYPLYIGRIHMMMEMIFKRYLDKFVKFKNVNINLRTLCNLSLPKFHSVCYGKK